MKKQIRIIGLALCLSISLFGCGEETSAVQNSTLVPAETIETDTLMGVPSNLPDVAENPDASFNEQTDQTQPVDKILTAEQQALIDAATGLDENTDQQPVPDGYPSTEEILVAIDGGESKLFWCAQVSEYSGTMDLQPVKTPDAESFVSALSDSLGAKYTVSTDAEVSGVVTITPDGSEPDMEAVLSSLSQLTGAEYIEIAAEEIYVAQYVPVINGRIVDAEGCFPAGADPIPGPYVSLSENGEIAIHTPLILSDTVDTIDTAELVTPETVETICRAYYENLIEGRVTIITDMTLGYYYSKDKESLLPAWQCDMTFYMSENGHNDSVLMDAQTGELLRK